MASTLRTITVFCGSSLGNDPRFEEAAKALGKCMAERGIDLIYGGGNVGLMGTVAKTVEFHGGKVSGFLPKFFLIDEAELFPEDELGKTVIVDDMHTRKRMMLEKADALIALPGGIGTLEELVEMISWRKLHLHQKPIGILNIAGFYDTFLEWISHGVKCGFIPKPADGLPYSFGLDCVSDSPEELINKLTDCLPKGTSKS